MASRPPVSDSSGIIPPSVDPEVALLLTNEETLCEKAITLLLKISSSIVQQPNEKRVRSLNLASRAMELTLLPAHGAFELLFFMGFQEANDRLVMPDDACLETVKMYQQQLHQLLNWKTSSSSSGSTMPALDAALLSPASLHSPASVRSNTPKSTPRSTAKENQAVDRKRLSSGESAGSKSGRSPSRVTAASVASSKNTSASLSTRGELPASVSSKKDAPRKKDIQASSLTRQQSCGSTSNVVNVPNPSINSNKSGSGTEGSSAVLKNGNLKNPGTASGKLPSGSSPSTSSSSRPPVPQTSTSCVKTPSRASPSISSQPSSSAQPSLLAFKASPQQIVSKAGGAKASDTASRSSSSSHASASTGGSSSSGSSSMASSVMTPVSSVSTTSGSTVTAAATGATSKKLSPYKLRPHQRWLSRFRGYLERVLTYENHMHQAKARSLMPVARLHSAASAALKADAAARKEEHKADANARAKETSEKSTKPFDFNDYLLLELTSWFKRDFFRWFDCGWCSACRCNMASKSTVPPTKHELEGEANTVEYYQCQTCGADRRFPRYLNVGRLLETREGRCGEWASCFTLCCRTLGFDARQVFDETDHTWTEVWSHSQSRWVHVDPCEGRVDCPLLYECGWGKALSYVTAVSRDEVIDVTWRYTLQPNEVKKRRDKVSEEELWQHLWGLTVQLQQQHQQHTRHQLHLRMAREMASFFSPARTPTKAELEGRSSGSLGWRVSRGETGVLQTTSHHTFTLHHTARITTLTVKYNPVRDSYLCEGTVGPAMLQGWQSGVHTAANLAIKREHDWHNVYIARTEGETAARVGEVAWRVRWESSRVCLDSLRVVLRHTTFHGAAVTWGVTFDGEHHGEMTSEAPGPDGSGHSGRDTQERRSSTSARRSSMAGNRIIYAGAEMSSGKLFGKDLSEYDEVDVDALLEQLSPEELELLAGDVDPDDSLVPPSERCGYKCEKESTGPLDRKQLIDHINEQAINEPDRPELVPYVPGTIRGKKWVPPPPPEPEEPEDPTANQVEVDLDEEFNSVLEIASEDEIVDLAAILGFHSMMNQDQYHASLLNKERPVGVGWGGITKATKFKPLPAEPPNDTDPEESIKRLKNDDPKFKELNLNNIRKMSDEQLGRLFGALESNNQLETLSMANTGICDRHLDALTSALSQNNTLRTLNLETNNITPTGVVRVMESLNKMHSVEEVRLANQQQSVLGNKIEMQLTSLIEDNPTLLRVGIHFEFNDARNRVSRQLQKNLDTLRKVRAGVASK